MIYKSLTYIKEYLSDKLKADGWTVELNAVSKEEQPSGRDILITLLQIEEERDTKSQEYYRKTDTGIMVQINPEIKINLYILISSQKEQYETALRQISQVIGIFQTKNTFDKKEINKAGIESLTLDLYSLTFEQNNSLWQTVGTKIMPAVMYKIRTLVVEESDTGMPMPIVLPEDELTGKGGVFIKMLHKEDAKDTEDTENTEDEEDK